ncbi:MAG TPA: DUF4271 domain-containing protein [Prolixibacteraceae bacterium]|nr:DUF4271 domain-containing protein [Prolixibacteraceae bacterium]
MQSNQIKSDSVNSNLNSNPAFLENKTFQNDAASQTVNLLDSTVLDSLNASYIAPDSVICFGSHAEWSQFRSTYIPKFDYRKDLLKPVPYDSLHTVLKGVEVVFPGKKLQQKNPDWLIGVLILSFLLFASVRLIFNKYLSQLIQSAVNYSTFSRLFRERYFNVLHASFRLDLIFNMLMALFGFQFLSLYKINLGVSNSFYVYLICLGIVTGYFTAKRIIYYLIGILTERKQEIQEYLFNITVFNRVLGLFLLPVTVTIAFANLSQVEIFVFGGLLIIIIFYMLSLYRGGKIFFIKQFPIFYLILYLCTLEIIPLFLIYNLLLI